MLFSTGPLHHLADFSHRSEDGIAPFIKLDPWRSIRPAEENCLGPIMLPIPGMISYPTSDDLSGAGLLQHGIKDRRLNRVVHDGEGALGQHGRVGAGGPGAASAGPSSATISTASGPDSLSGGGIGGRISKAKTNARCRANESKTSQPSVLRPCTRTARSGLLLNIDRTGLSGSSPHERYYIFCTFRNFTQEASQFRFGTQMR